MTGEIGKASSCDHIQKNPVINPIGKRQTYKQTNGKQTAGPQKLNWKRSFCWSLSRFIQQDSYFCAEEADKELDIRNKFGLSKVWFVKSSSAFFITSENGSAESHKKSNLHEKLRLCLCSPLTWRGGQAPEQLRYNLWLNPWQHLRISHTCLWLHMFGCHRTQCSLSQPLFCGLLLL